MEYLNAFLCGIAVLLVLYLFVRAVEAIILVLLYIVFAFIAASPLLIILFGVLIAVQSPQYGTTIEICGNMVDIRTACIGAAIVFLLSVVIMVQCLKSKLFRKIFVRINPPPPATESVKIDLTHLIPKK